MNNDSAPALLRVAGIGAGPGLVPQLRCLDDLAGEVQTLRVGARSLQRPGGVALTVRARPTVRLDGIPGDRAADAAQLLTPPASRRWWAGRRAGHAAGHHRRPARPCRGHRDQRHAGHRHAASRRTSGAFGGRQAHRGCRRGRQRRWRRPDGLRPRPATRGTSGLRAGAARGPRTGRVRPLGTGRAARDRRHRGAGAQRPGRRAELNPRERGHRP